MTILDYTSSYDEETGELDTTGFSWVSSAIQCGFFSDVGDLCKYCRIPMDRPIEHIDDGGGGHDEVVCVVSCARCGWWHYSNNSSTYLGDGDRHVQTKHRFGLLRAFPTDSMSLPVTSLRIALRDSPELLHDIHPLKMEQLVASVFRDHLDCDVRHIGMTGDGGIDLILIDGSEQQVVQVKRRANPQSKEGVKVLRALIGAMVLEKQRNGIFVTTADGFTRGAKQIAKRVKTLSAVDKLDLIDVHRLLDMLRLNHSKTEMPWRVALAGEYIPAA